MAYIGKTPSQAVRSRYFYTATGGETSLSGADDNGDTLIFADGNYVDVYLNGVLLVAGSDYNVNTVNTIAGLAALTALDIVEIVVYDTFSVFGGTFQGTLTANQFVGPLTGNVTGELDGAVNFIVKNTSGGTIIKGTPVYISGHSGNIPEVNVADADDPAKMPAIGVATEDFNDNTQGNIVTFGKLIGFNTAAFSVNDELYVSTTGTLTATRPNASNTEVQKVAKVIRSHATNGQLFIMGAGRSNDVPNAIITNSINLSSTTTVDSVLDEDTMTSDSATALATQQSIKAYVDSQIGSNNELSEILTNGNTTNGNNISFGDNDKAIFGAGSDLQIYHDGLNSYISEQGAGGLRIQSSSNMYLQTDGGLAYITMTDGGAVGLRYNNSEKLATTATGVDVTGTLTSDDAGFYQSSGTSQLRVGASSAYNWNISRDNVSTGGLQIQSKDAAADVTRAFFGINGDISFYEDTGTTPKFFWDASAEALGIGTSPSAKLSVNDANGIPIHMGDISAAPTSQTAAYVGVSTSSLTGGNGDLVLAPRTSDARSVVFYTGNGTSAERMRITSAGDVQISSNGTPDTSGTNSGMNISAVYGTFQTNHGGNDYPILNIHTSGVYNRYLQFRWANTGVGSISTNGSTTSYNTTSDYRLKENVVADWDATTRLKQLNPVRFNFIADPDTTVDGFLAHEVQDIVPEAITGTKDAMRDEEYEVTPAVLDEDGNVVTPAVMGTRSVPDYQGIDQSKLVPLLVKTIQELEARITALETA